MSTLLERLRDVGCDREPFTPAHAKCICRLANAAADEIERLTSAVEFAHAEGFQWPSDPLPATRPKALRMLSEDERKNWRSL